MKCETCGRTLLPPRGPDHAEIMFIGNAPTRYDFKEMQPWTGNAGNLLLSEIRKAGMMPHETMITNMWQHIRNKDCELAAHIDVLLPQMEGRKMVVLMGADPVKYFTELQVSTVNGLRIDTLGEVNKLPESIGKVYAMFNPAIAMHGKLGEIRLAMQKIAEGFHGH